MATRFYIYAFFFDSGMNGEIEMEKVARGQCVWSFTKSCNLDAARIVIATHYCLFRIP